MIKKLDKDYNELVGKRIKEFRIRKDISQEELGKYLKLPKQTISTIEKGRRRVTIQELDMLSGFFDEPLSAFIKEDHEYAFPYDTEYGELPVFMSDFLEKYKYACKKVAIYKDKPGKMFTNTFIDAIKMIYRDTSGK
jgi:transcriptional regulator with XRE-family HTH domain